MTRRRLVVLLIFRCFPRVNPLCYFTLINTVWCRWRQSLVDGVAKEENLFKRDIHLIWRCNCFCNKTNWCSQSTMPTEKNPRDQCYLLYSRIHFIMIINFDNTSEMFPPRTNFLFWFESHNTRPMILWMSTQCNVLLQNFCNKTFVFIISANPFYGTCLNSTQLINEQQSTKSEM